MSEWIKVEDSLPPNDQEVLCWTTLGVYLIGYQEDGVFDCDLRGVLGNPEKVTHWMPLPEPPK